jgi:predicted nuclease of predicted toxin-antitoxin system
VTISWLRSSLAPWCRANVEWYHSALREVPVDTQLPAKLAELFHTAGHDVVHTSQLPERNRTTDAVLATLADEEDRAVVTKDRDFRDSHLLRHSPQRLLVVATGNITNKDLLSLFADNLDTVVAALNEARFVELGSTGLVIHDGKS